MKLISCLFFVALLTSCASLTNDPWEWLDEPENQNWKRMTISFPAQQISFSVPDRLSSGNQMIASPEWKDADHDLLVSLQQASIDQPAVKLTGIFWEYPSGGLNKLLDSDFTFTAFVFHIDEARSLLSMNVEERILWQRDRFQKTYGPADKHSKSAKDQLRQAKLDGDLRIELFQSQQGYEWIRDNDPFHSFEHDNFRMPISDDLELEFSFGYRIDLDTAGKPGNRDVQWLERRKKIARKVLDTVTISPPPRDS